MCDIGLFRQPLVSRNGEIDRRAYTLCGLEQLIDSLRRRDVFVDKSDRWGDPRAKLLSGKDWESARPKILKGLGRSSNAKEELAALSHELDTAYRRTAENLPTNAKSVGFAFTFRFYRKERRARYIDINGLRQA